MLCEYGCNLEANFRLRNGKWCCSKNYQSCVNIKGKNSKGVKIAHDDGRIPSFNDEHRRKSRETYVNNIKKMPFEFWGCKLQKSFILEEQKGRCLKCGIDEWLGSSLSLELDHIDGNNKNNKRENLRLLCPNCHSQTPTYCGKNVNTGKVKVSDEILIIEYLRYKNIHHTLLKVGLVAKGGNYNRMKKLILKYNLNIINSIDEIINFEQ